jgi:hypothetical protein
MGRPYQAASRLSMFTGMRVIWSSPSSPPHEMTILMERQGCITQIWTLPTVCVLQGRRLYIEKPISRCTAAETSV